MVRSFCITGVLAAGLGGPVAFAQPVIYASGQLLIPGNPEVRENSVYEINISTGVATRVSPITSGLPAALAGTPSGELYGFSNGQLVAVDPISGIQTDIGSNNGLSATAFDITADARGFILPFDPSFDTQQLHGVDLSTGAATPIGSASAIGDAIDTALGTPLGDADPFVISLGSVGNTLYGIELDTETLVSIDPATGVAQVVGAVGAVGDANGGDFDGFAALTGVDEDLDGTFDALYGAVNFSDDEPTTGRLGGVARFDLSTGAWTLVGTNPGVIFFGFGSSPAPNGCAADANNDGDVNILDVIAFINVWNTGAAEADFNQDGTVNVLDVVDFIAEWQNGCP